MKKKIISLFLLLVMLLSPVVLSGCIGFGGIDDDDLGDLEEDTSGSGGGESEEEEIDPNDPSNFVNCFSSVKAIEKIDMTDLSAGSQAYVFTTQVMNQVNLISTEILLRLCGHFGMGLTTTYAATHGINLSSGIVPESQSYYAIQDLTNSGANAWAWKHIANTDVLFGYDEFGDQYAAAYLTEYAPEGKPNHKVELVRNVYNLLVGEMPANTNEQTLRQVATKFDHLGFTEAEQQKLTDFVLNTIIGTANVTHDDSLQTGGYYGYRKIVPQIIKNSVERVTVTIVDGQPKNQPAYPFYIPVLFADKNVEYFGMDLFSDDKPFGCDAKAYDSLVLGSRFGLDVKGFTISLEVADERITQAVNLDIYAKYQHDGNTVRAKLTKTISVNPGAYNINENANDVTIEFAPPSAEDFGDTGMVEIDPSTLPNNSEGNEFYEIHNLNALRLGVFTNNSLAGLPLGNSQLYSTVNDTNGYRKYFEMHEENEIANIEYVDDSTSYIQLFFKFDSEFKDIKFKIGFMDINIVPVL